MVDLAAQWADISLVTGSQGIVVKDWDGDGHDEIFSAQGGKVAVLQHTTNYQYEQVWAAAEDAGWGFQDVNGDGTEELWTVRSDGQVTTYKPFTYPPLTTELVDAGVQWATLTDLFGNGQLLLTYGGYPGMLRAYTWPRLHLTWSYKVPPCPSGVDKLRLLTLQGDADPQREIVLNCGEVIDPVKNSEEWRYSGGFGIALDAADLDGDGHEEMAGIADWGYFTLFDLEKRTPLWQISTSDNDSLLLANVTGDAMPEIVIGDGQTASVHVYDARSRQQLWTVNNLGVGVSGIGVGDADDDGKLDLIWGTGAESFSGARHLCLTPINKTTSQFTLVDYDGPYKVVPMQLDDDPALEMVVFTRSTNNGYGAPAYFILDGTTGKVEPSLNLQLNGWPPASVVGGADIWLLSANIDDDPYNELVMEASGQVFFVDHDGKGLGKRTLDTTVYLDWMGDADGDGVPELIGHTFSQVRIYSLPALALEWQTASFSEGVSSVAVSDTDGDGHREVVFHGASSYLRAYDLKTHIFKWQMGTSQQAVGLAIGNADGIGDQEILVIENGWLTFYNARTRELLRRTAHIDDQYSQSPTLTFAQMTNNPYPQLIVNSGSVYLFKHPYQNEPSQTLFKLSASPYNSYGPSVTVADVDNDRHMDVLVGDSLGFGRWGARAAFADLQPPVATILTPSSGLDLISRDAFAEARFSKAMDPTTITSANAQLQCGGNSLAAALEYDTTTHILRLTPHDLLPARCLISVWLGPGLQDQAGNGLDGNRNGVGGEPQDSFSWQFSTGDGTDTVGPHMSHAQASPSQVWPGMTVLLTANADDTDPLAASSVVAVEYFTDTLSAPGTGTPMVAVDGAFDERQEDVTARLDTANWTDGHMFYVRGQDSLGNWGDPVTVTVSLLTEGPNKDWPTFAHDAAHTGYNLAQSGVMSYTLTWERDLYAMVGATESRRSPKQVVVAYGIVAAQADPYSGVAAILAFDAARGTELWRKTLNNKYSINPPSLAYGNVYFQQGNQSSDTYVFALNALTGSEVWRTFSGAQWETYYHPTIAAGKVFVNGGHSSGACGYDAFGGTELWCISLDGYDSWTPTYAGNFVYTFTDGNFRSLDPHSGAQLWSVNVGWSWIGYSMDRMVAVGGNTAYLTTRTDSGGDLVAIDLLLRGVKWRASGRLIGTPAVADGDVYALDGNQLKVFDGTTGAVKWSYDAGQALTGAPLVTAGDVYVASADHTWVVSRTTHQPVWDVARGGWLTVANNQLFIAQPDGTLAAFNATLRTPDALAPKTR
jgi:outer membrane protein assembly factor BamB